MAASCGTRSARGPRGPDQISSRRRDDFHDGHQHPLPFNQTILQIFRGFGYDVIIGFDQFQRVNEIVPLIESRPGVERAEMWVFYTAKAQAPGAEGPGSEHEVFLRGIPKDTRLFTPELTAGRNLDPNDGRALLLNQKLARKMGLSVGDRVTPNWRRGKSTWTIVG
jgi:hypothetical protein